MTTLYGIKNCDTVRKARKWLDSNQIDYQFHDLRGDGLERDQLEAWEAQLGWETLLNKRGTTWRQLPDDIKAGIDRESALKVMLDNPAIIKRPVLAIDKRLQVGFKEADYQQLLDV